MKLLNTYNTLTTQERRNYTSLAFCVSMLALNEYGKQIPYLYNGMGVLTIVYNTDMKEQTIDYIIHHSMGIMLGGIITFNTYTLEGHRPEIFDSWANLEMSTVVLCLYYISKNKIFRLPFLASFIYYRFVKFIPANFSIQASDEIDAICTDHYVLQHDACVKMVNCFTNSIIALNTMWLLHMFKKLKKEIYPKN